jgi:hypothetical protein
MSVFKQMLIDSMERHYPSAPGWQRHSDTSHAAAQSMRPHYTVQQKRIVDFLQGQGVTGGTYTEICSGTQLSAPSVCGRMVELVRGKHVIKSNDTRATPSNRQAHVYLHKDFAGREQ